MGRSEFNFNVRAQRVHYKSDRNLGSEMVQYEANADFKETATSDESYSRSPGNDDEVSITCFPHALNTVLQGW